MVCFDVEENRYLHQAIAKARPKGVKIALSNPCFEIWLVLHIREQTAFIDRHKVQKQARDLGLMEGKKAKRVKEEALDTLMKNVEVARKRAKDLDKMHRLNGSKPGSNPSTGMWRLVDTIRQA